MTPRSRSAQEMTDIQLEVKRLERDLNQALELNNRAIADRYTFFFFFLYSLKHLSENYFILSL